MNDTVTKNRQAATVLKVLLRIDLVGQNCLTHLKTTTVLVDTSLYSLAALHDGWKKRS